MDKLKVLDLFSGIGGFSLGLERAGGFETVSFCEINEYCRRVLNRHWPDVPIMEDVRKVDGGGFQGVEVICGGFPCQNISNAGAAHGVNQGLDGDRSGLWFEYERLIREIRPNWAIIENVKSLTGRGLDRVLGGLAKIGYDAEWQVLSGPFVGLPQARERVWIVAYPSGKRVSGLFESIHFSQAGQGRSSGSPDLFDIARAPFGGDSRFPQPLLRGMDVRPSRWVDRVQACGNSVMPQIPEMIGRAILEVDRI